MVATMIRLILTLVLLSPQILSAAPYHGYSFWSLSLEQLESALSSEDHSIWQAETAKVSADYLGLFVEETLQHFKSTKKSPDGYLRKALVEYASRAQLLPESIQATQIATLMSYVKRNKGQHLLKRILLEMNEINWSSCEQALLQTTIQWGRNAYKEPPTFLERLRKLMK